MARLINRQVTPGLSPLAEADEVTFWSVRVFFRKPLGSSVPFMMKGFTPLCDFYPKG
jgi:hypothetical protein